MEEEDNNKDLITPNELRERLSLSKATLYKWVSEGKIPVIRLSGLLRFRYSDVLKKFEDDNNNAK